MNSLLYILILALTMNSFAFNQNTDNESETCHRSYIEKTKTGEYDLLDLVNPVAGYFENKLSKSFEGLTNESKYKWYSSRWSIKDKLLYENFLNGKVSCNEMIRKVTKIAWIGDSLSKDFFVSESKFYDLYQVRTKNQSSAIFDQDNPRIDSLFEKISKKEPVYFMNLSRVGANVATPLNFLERNLARKRTMQSRVLDILKMDIVPDIIAIWLGHNDLDWAIEANDNNKSFQEIKKERLENLRNRYKQNIKYLITGLRKKTNKKISIVLFNMANVEDYVNEAKASIEKARKSNYQIYPENENGVHEVFVAIQSDYRNQMVSLFRESFQVIKKVSNELIVNYDLKSNLHISYSEELYNADWGNVNYFNKVDGWHLGDFGKNEIARHALFGLESALNYVR